MRPRTIARVALLAAAALVATVALTGRERPYTLQLRMANADGLKNGSPVTIGGVRIGKVHVSVDVRGHVAVARLEIERRYAPLGRDTSAQIVAQNLLGQKQVQLTSTGRDAPSGFVVPAARITPATDLDRVLDVLDAPTRARLAIFVNEAGAAFTGRREDFSTFLRDIAPAIGNANQVVGQLADDNVALGRLVATSDRYVATVTRRRADVVRLVDRFGQAAVTGATKRAQLRATLAQAPGGLHTLQAFLAALRRTTRPLRPAARELAAAAAPLRGTLDQLGPFTTAATPALRRAVGVAPTLTTLADEATPVLRKAAPTLAALRQTAQTDLPPVLDVTDKALNNTLAVVDNWSGAIQYRDSLSHVFRGEASISPDLLNSVVERLLAHENRGRRRAGRRPIVRRPLRNPAPSTTPHLPQVNVPSIKTAVDHVLGDVQQTVNEVTGIVTGSRQGGDPSNGLLGFLLGK